MKAFYRTSINTKLGARFQYLVGGTQEEVANYISKSPSKPMIVDGHPTILSDSYLGPEANILMPTKEGGYYNLDSSAKDIAFSASSQLGANPLAMTLIEKFIAPPENPVEVISEYSHEAEEITDGDAPF